MKKVHLKINGLPKQVVAGPEMVLLDLLRDNLGLTGTKQSCDRKGQCGSCTVIVNGRAVRSCLSKVADLDGADVISIEGLGTPDNPHLIQEAFVLSGAIQCGFCTPGMIMATKTLLDKNLNPSTDEIKRALRGNLCRCTGYVKIIEAVKLAGRFLRGESTPDQVRPDPNGPVMGVSHPRPSSMLKACGVADFSADIMIPGSLEVAAVRSPHPHALIKGINSSAAESMPGILGVMTAKDIKGSNRLTMFTTDRPLLCEDRVRSIGDPVAIVVAETREQAVAAAEAVVVDYELLPALLTYQEAMAEGAIRIHSDSPNLCYKQPLVKGNAERALAESTNMVESRFTTHWNHQAPLEPEATVAYWEGEGEEVQLVVVGRSINIHKHLAMLQDALGWENMRYEEAFVGGQFGIKIEVTSEGLAAAAALHFQRPVRYMPTLAESILMTPKRHPFEMEVKLACDANAQLTAVAMDYYVDNGAYTSVAKNIVNRPLWIMCGNYHIPNVDATGHLVYTNNIYGSAARGAGGPQHHFGLECAVNMLAHKIGMDPLEFRKRNSLRPGQRKSSGPPVDEWPFPELCDALRPHYDRALSDAKSHKTGPIRRGVGLAAGAFGTGSSADIGTAAVEMDPDDGVTIYAAVADPGEGNDSMLTQLTADTLGIPLSKVRLVVRDTDRTTASGPAAGSRITFMVGGALMAALEQLKAAMAETGAVSYRALKEAGKPTRYIGTKKNPDLGGMDPKTGQGPTFHVQIHALQMAELEVNIETGEVRVLKMTAAVDAGTLINPVNVEGQVEGGMDQGVGWALREEFVAGQTKDWVTFKFPTTRTAFDMEVVLRETQRSNGPKGAVGVGEMTMVPTAPAVMAAIHDACGVWINDLPATPDRVKAALAQGK